MKEKEKKRAVSLTFEHFRRHVSTSAHLTVGVTENGVRVEDDCQAKISNAWAEFGAEKDVL